MIKNKKSKIIGSDTHALGGADPTDTHGASLSGSVVFNTPTNFASGFSGFGESYSTPRHNSTQIDPNTQYVTVNVTPPANCIAIIVTRGYIDIGGGGGPGLLRRGTTTLVSHSTGGSGVYIDTTPGTSATSYNLFNQGTQSFVKVQTMDVIFVTLNDTHAGTLSGSAGTDTHVLSGSNNQSTRANGIIQ